MFITNSPHVFVDVNSRTQQSYTGEEGVGEGGRKKESMEDKAILSTSKRQSKDECKKHILSCQNLPACIIMDWDIKKADVMCLFVYTANGKSIRG